MAEGTTYEWCQEGIRRGHTARVKRQNTSVLHSSPEQRISVVDGNVVVTQDQVEVQHVSSHCWIPMHERAVSYAGAILGTTLLSGAAHRSIHFHPMQRPAELVVLPNEN